MREKLKAKKMTGTHDPNIPRVSKIRKSGGPPLLANQKVKRCLGQAIERQAVYNGEAV